MGSPTLTLNCLLDSCSSIMPAVNHVVLLRLKSDTTDEVLAVVISNLLSLQQKIEGIRSISHGKYSSNEGMNKGFNYGFTVVFESEHNRDLYLIHPDHEIVKQQLTAIIEDVIAFDYLL